MKRVVAGILIAATVASAHAEPMYVSDKLVVNVYEAADQESTKITTLDSGDAVELIEKLDTFSHVRLADSREGWIKSSYLSSQVPAIVRLKELEKERGASAPTPSAQVTEELKQLKEQNAALQVQLAAAKAAQEPAPVVTIAPSASQPSPQTDASTSGSRPASNSNAHTHAYTWGAAFGLVGGLFGFAMGYQALARRIRRKYGSMKIY